MKKQILLIEPSYKNKYPPLGLMKISTYHKQKGDDVVFFKGCSPELRAKSWDRIYISTLFTFYWNKTIETIKYYRNSVANPKNVYVGGIIATLMKDELHQETGVTIVEGLLNKRGKLRYKNDDIIDNMMPDYSIIEKDTNPLLDYIYPTKDSYIGYATRGCVRRCAFCAVPILEPVFSESKSLIEQVKDIRDNFGEKKHLLLLDNNILASNRFAEIVDDVKSLGFEKGARFYREAKGKRVGSNRYVDFNQGIDARLLTKEKMKLISEIAISPLRIAFDHIEDKDIYIEKVRMAADYGIATLSNYILFNFEDTPEDFYERLRINVVLNDEFKRNGYKSRIWSFPMKYSPIMGVNCKNRKFIGPHWNRKYLRGIQCILHATHGVVGPRNAFFQTAFGESFNAFLEILMMPEDVIIYRNKSISDGTTGKWRDEYKKLSSKSISTLLNFMNNHDSDLHEDAPLNLQAILEFYRKKVL